MILFNQEGYQLLSVACRVVLWQLSARSQLSNARLRRNRLNLGNITVPFSTSHQSINRWDRRVKWFFVDKILCNHSQAARTEDSVSGWSWNPKESFVSWLVVLSVIALVLVLRFAATSCLKLCLGVPSDLFPQWDKAWRKNCIKRKIHIVKLIIKWGVLKIFLRIYYAEFMTFSV